MKPTHLMRIAGFSAADINALLRSASALKANPADYIGSRPLAGKTIGLVFEKASTRTRISFEVAMTQLGGHSLVLGSEGSQMTRGESVADTAKVLSRYLDGLVIRTFGQDILDEWASHATIPVINGLTDLHHPCQALADLLTIQECTGQLQGVKVAYIGDGNNVAHSLIEAAVCMGMSISLACPLGYAPQQAIVDAARVGVGAGTVECVTDPMIAVKDADFIYTDVWTSMGFEGEQETRTTVFSGYQVNAALVAAAKPTALVMHCLPAHRGEEIAADVVDGPQSIVLDQAENRLHVQKAILVHLLGDS
ncbi:MAG TPA: ornithine carbamoyltransferase [Nitrospirales bacterium]|nr:ornithine carbamoyltransferase [Nitrospirales bacterium]HIB53694.1 ornithine carbamoyltransferase [Nitrospirales bacterium]